jgi:serine/threonine protein kinase
MSLAAGDKLGHYEVLSLLGQGGMGEVYRARDARTGRDRHSTRCRPVRVVMARRSSDIAQKAKEGKR